MGASNFYTESRGKDMGTAYRNACEEAIEYYGHQEGYNGTISTTSGYIDKTDLYLATARKSGMTRQKGMSVVQDESLDHTDKWGNCWGVKIKNGHYAFMGWAAE
jgi:hypothetical protein